MQGWNFRFIDSYVVNVDQILIYTAEMYSICQMLRFDRSYDHIQKHLGISNKLLSLAWQPFCIN